MYTIIELQTNNGISSHIVSKEAAIEKAQQKYYTICAAACVSAVEIHAAVILDEAGQLVTNISFNHPKL